MSGPKGQSPESGTPEELTDLYTALVLGELTGDEALFASQQMLQILLNSMTDAVFWKDTNLNFLGCNKAFTEIVGVESALLMGKSDVDMPWAHADEYDWEWFSEWDRKVIDSGEPSYGILERLTRPDGSISWVETNKIPLRDPHGEVVGLLGNIKDVTASREAEEQLNRTLEELDDRVQRRTAELERANEALRLEVDDRIRSQAEERQQRTYAETLRDTAAAMSQTFDIQMVTEQALSGLGRLVSNDLAAIVLKNANDALEISRCHVGFGYLPEDRPDETEIESSFISGLTIIERLEAGPGPVIIAEPSAALGPARSVLGARMRQADRVVGYLFVESATTGFFSDDHADRLGAVADQAGAVVSNALLVERVSEIAAAEERQRLARDLHDAINQTLWTASLSAESLLGDVPEDSGIHLRIDRLRQLTRGALSEMRGLLLELRPGELAEVDLRELMQHLLNAIEARMKVVITSDLQSVELHDPVHIALYRIAQQSLSNMVQHSNATEVDVRLMAGPPTVLRVADNGDGFDVANVPGGHLGLQIMRERAEAVGAVIEIESELGAGTTVTVTVEP